ncbi:MAG TPA: M67 family metallopeptidase [Solirubrobacteraceae bacterium]|nr:M67 family metallopeptidase [Solirubrobacteraceae bacterium]
MEISPQLLDDVVAHALEDPANEICGVVAVRSNGDGAQAVAVHRARNVHESPLRFEIDPRELLDLYNTIDGDGLDLGAIYHSHVRSAPYPSQTDINFAAGWPGVEWIIVGLAGSEPEVRSYLIEGGTVRELPLQAPSS